MLISRNEQIVSSYAQLPWDMPSLGFLTFLNTINGVLILFYATAILKGKKNPSTGGGSPFSIFYRDSNDIPYAGKGGKADQ